MRIILPAALLSMLLALAYLATYVPAYTASAVLLVDRGRSNAIIGDAADLAFRADVAEVENQAALLTSDELIKQTAEKIGLAAGDHSAPLSLAKRVTAKRREMSLLIDLAVTASSPEHAIRTAEAWIDAYSAKLTATNYIEAQRLNATADESLNRLRDSVRRADAKSEPLSPPQTTKRSADYLAELDQALRTARAVSSETKERQHQIELAIKSEDEFEALPQGARTPLMQNLNDQASVLKARETALSSRLRARHPALREVRAQLAGLSQKRTAELKRLAVDAEAAADLARRRERALSDQVATEKAEAAKSMAAAAPQNHDDGAASSDKNFADAVEAALRAQQSASRRSLEIQVLNRPTAHRVSSVPNAFVVLPLALLAGLTAGLALAFASELMNSAVRSSKDLTAVMRNGFIAEMPALERPGPIASLLAPFDAFNWATDDTPFSRSKFNDIASAVADGKSQPEQAYCQSVLRLLAQIKAKQRPGRPHVAMLVAARSKSGVSAATAAVAYAAALSGERVLLIDANSCRPDLSTILTTSPPRKTSIVLDSKQQLQGLVSRDAESGLASLPIALANLRSLTTSQSRRLVGGLSGLIQDYDLAMIDGGAILEDCSVLCLLPATDQIVIVARTDATEIADVTRALQALGLGQDRVTGSVLTFSPVDGAL